MPKEDCDSFHTGIAYTLTKPFLQRVWYRAWVSVLMWAMRSGFPGYWTPLQNSSAIIVKLCSLTRCVQSAEEAKEGGDVAVLGKYLLILITRVQREVATVLLHQGECRDIVIWEEENPILRWIITKYTSRSTCCGINSVLALSQTQWGHRSIVGSLAVYRSLPSPQLWLQWSNKALDRTGILLYLSFPLFI